jgi:chemotaxis protein MotB
MTLKWNQLPMILLLAGVALASNACCGEQDAAQIAALTDQNDRLKAQNNDYREQLAACQNENQAIQNELADKDAIISQKNQTIAELQGQLAEKPEQVTVVAEDWTATPFGDKIAVGSDVLFASGRAKLTRNGMAKLDKVIRDLKSNYAGLPVRVYGYTDSDPIKKTKKLWADNLDLSANRAMAVTRYLRKNGVDAERIETIAMGQTNPVASNSTRDGKARNRRVEIMAVKQR